MKGFNLRVQELRENIARDINASQLPVSVSGMILNDFMQAMKAAELNIIVSEKQAYEKELAEKEGESDEEIRED